MRGPGHQCCLPFDAVGFSQSSNTPDLGDIAMGRTTSSAHADAKLAPFSSCLRKPLGQSPQTIMNDAVDLSIIIPTFQRVDMLEEALRSVLRIEGLSLEVLVVDDDAGASAAPVIDKLNDPRIHYFRFEPSSAGRPALLRNWAARMARGELLYFLDDDDRVVDGAVSAACRLLRESDAGVLVGGITPFGASEERVDREDRYFQQARKHLSRFRGRKTLVATILFSDTPIVCSCCMIKRAVFLATDGFDASLPLWEDSEFYMRAIRNGGVVYLDQALVERRVGGPALSASAPLEALMNSYRIARKNYGKRYGSFELLQLRLWRKLISFVPLA